MTSRKPNIEQSLRLIEAIQEEKTRLENQLAMNNIAVSTFNLLNCISLLVVVT